MPQDNIKALYGALKDSYELGTEDEFRQYLSNSKNREALRKELENDYETGDSASFSKYLGFDTPSQIQSSMRQRMYPNGQVPTEHIKREEAQPTPQQQPAKVEQPKQPQQTKQEPAGAYKPTWQEQMAFGSTLGVARYAVENATKGIYQMEQASKQASPFGSGNVGIGNNQSLRKGKQTFDAEKGTFVDTYLTSDGREFRDLQQANNAQAELDNISDNIRYQEAMRQLGMTDIASEQGKDINQRLKEAYAERMELQRQMTEIAKKETAARKGPRFPSMVGGPAETYTMIDESKNLSSALRLLERRITALEAERDDKGQSMFWRGTMDTLKDPSAYSLGLTDLADTGVMSQLKSKIDAVGGDLSKLSGSEKALVRNYLMNQEEQRLNENRGNMYSFGQMFGQSLPFMAEFYLTGGFMGLGQAGTRLGTNAGLRMSGSELGKQMTKNLGGRILLKTGQSVLKGTGRVSGALIGGALQSNTIGAAKTYSDISNRNMGNLTLNDKGNLDFKDGEGIAEAFLKGQLTNAFENGSELLGPAFDFAPNYLARVIKNKVAGGAVNKLLSNKAWRGTNKVLRKFGVQGLFGEGMEEEANNIGNVLIGESNWFKDPNEPNKPAFFDGEEQFKTWAGVALTGAVLRGPAIAASGYQKAQYYANKYNLNASDNQMRTVLGDYDRYQSIKSMLDGATNENIGSVLNNIMNGGQLNDQEKEAVVFYAQDLVNLRGFNIGSVVAEAVGAQPRPRVASYQVKADGKSFDELDENGNVLAHHEYETNDEMKEGLYELQQQRFDDNLQSDISIMKTRPNGQFDQLVSDYLMQNELFMTPSEFEAILAKPSLERTDDEQQLVAPFSELLHNTVYDNTMLHEEQSQQDGEEIADADSIDIEAGSEQGAAINAEWQAAQQARNELFSHNEELAQEVLSRENNGLSHQEIISSLTTFRPEDVQAVIDFYNKKARYEGYINRKAQKIDEEAHNSRERHTMKGTIDGVADLSGVHTITDGTNRYYLVSGDITTDPATGRITGSTSGLIVGMDLDGSFVQLNEGDGYMVEPVTQSLDQFEEAERVRLQELLSATIDPNGAQAAQEGSVLPQGTEQAGADLNNAGGEAGAASGTGANDPSATAPVTPTTPSANATGTVADTSGNTTGTPAVSIESVTDKDGIKRYENGVGVDDAIADILADGFDVGEVADASIGEAQAVIDKINGKDTKSRKDLMDRKNAKGVIDYYQALKERAAMLSHGTEEAPANGEENVNNQPGQPASGGNVVPSQAVGETTAAKPQVTVTVEEQKQERIKALKAELGELFDDDFTKANDVFELVSMWIGRKRNLAWDDVNGKRGLQNELGWTRKIGGDTKFIETLLAKKGEGMGVDEFVHMVWESEENTVDGEKRFDTDEIKNALLELLRSAGSKSDVVDYAVNNRERAARAALEAQQQMQQEEEESGEIQVENLTAEQIADMEANLPFAAPVDGEDIPDSPITQLMKLVQELMQQEGMPQIKLVDTDRMSDDEWIDIASQVYGGAFMDEETVNEVRDYALTTGVIRDDDGTILVFSDSQTPEDVKSKIQTILDYANTLQEEGRNDGRDTIVERTETETPQEQKPEAPAAAGAAGTESQGSTEPVEPVTPAEVPQGTERDEYLQPRNEKEEQIIADVMAQLQQDIDAAIKERDKAASDLQKAQAKESDRATDMFSDDEAFQEPGQLFSFDDMGGTDRTQEGVNRRTAGERKTLEEAQKKLDKLQSEAERNSRIRGALDNERRQTSFAPEVETSGTVAGQPQSREEYLASHPLTEEQIMADTEATEDEKLNAIDFLRGEDDSAISRFYYDGIYERAQKKADTIAKRKARFQGKGEKPATPSGNTEGATTDPIAAIDAAASSFREDQERKAQDQQDIDDALKEFNDFLDGAKGSSVLDKFMRKGLEGNDKAQASLLDAFTLTNEAQRMFLKDLLRLASKVGYAYIKSGVHDVQAWSRKMSDSIGAKLREVLGWDDAIIGEFVDEVWQQKYTVDGQRMRLSEHAERLKKGTKNTEEHPYTSFREFVNDSGINVTDDVVKGKLQKFAEAKRAKFGFEKSDSPLGYTSEVSNISIGLFPEEETLLKQWRNGTVTWVDKENECIFSITYKPAQYMGRKDNLIIKKEYLTKEKPNNAKDADTTVNVNKQEDNEPENVVSSQQEASEDKPKTKDGWMKKMNDVFKELCKKYGVPDDPIILNQWGGRYRFDYRITKGYRLDQFEPYYEAYKKKLDEEVEPATDKQLALIDRLAEPNEKKMLHSIKLNKISASYVIDILKAAEDAISNRMSTADVFEEYANELEKVAKMNGWEPEPKLEGDSAEFAERQQKIAQLSKKIRAKLQGIANWGDQPKPLSAYKQIVKELGIENLSDTDLQELIETEVVNLAREIANKEGLTDEKKFQKIVKLYEGQPSLNARDNDRINKQQYSTPAPMAFLMGKFLKEDKEVKSGLEPSAGNGMLTLNLPKEVMHVNDIDEMRLSNLAKQGFGEVTSQDGTQAFGEKKYDVVITNPPFGSVPAKTYDGYTVTSLEQQMVLNALESMKDDGRAAIIIGGNTEYAQNGTIKGRDKAFLNYLYQHYNVVDVINCDGKALYSRQGTGFNVRMILINGRRPADAPVRFAPTIQKARAERVNSYDELYKRVNDDILSDSNESAGVHDTASGESNGKHDNGHAGASSETGVRNVQPGRSSGQRQLLDSDGQPVSGGVGSTQGGTEPRTDTSVGGRNDVVHGTGTTATQSSGSAPSPAEQEGNVPNRRNDTERHDGRLDVPVGAGQRGTGTAQQTEQPAVKRGLGTEKVPYRKQSSNPFTLQSLMPAEQADVVKKALEDLGDVDQFLVDELGYSSKEELHQALAAEQIDSVAMAIHQMNQGNAFIIGDQTGIGKGRQAAALIRYGVKKGGFPVFITVKKGLFSDMYRDLCDIGSPGLRPFIWSADDTEHSADVTDKNGNVVYKRPSDKEQKRVVDYINKYGKLPPEYDYIITTYDSFKGGTKVYEEGEKKDRNFGKKSITTGARNSQAKRDALEVLAQNSYVIMDESHNAGGEGSAVSGYLQYITTKAKGVTFLSATFAKRPGNMPIYSLKTAIAKAGVKIGELIDAVKQGGATFQEIMSKALTEAGQMIRRERDMTGVTIDWKGIENEAVIEKQRQQYDTIIGLFNDIIDFQRRYVDPIVNKKNDEAADEQGEVDHTPGTRDMGINNTPFASRTYNMVQQVLLSLKAEEAAKRAIEHLKMGHKPVIALANTNEGAADEVSTGEDMEMPDLSVNLKKGLQGTLRITKKDAFGNSTNEMIPFDELSEEGRARYKEIMDAIENASSGLSLSPIDVIKNELKKAGYKVGELTGRKQEFVYNEDGTVKRVKRQDSDKKRVAADFNNGKLDALILNKSAGTGISLHASSKFEDQRQRVMIVAQAQGDVNDEVQIRGRIDRTGQVLRGMYEYVVSQIPSEQRLLMMLKAKLRSLDANTTSSQKSKFNEMQVQDIINKYGDDIVIQYLAEHTDLAAKMVDPLKWGEGFETMPAETLIANASKEGEAGKTASKVLGRMALLKVAEQEKMLQEIGDLYQAEIDRLNEMGENDLEITEMPLKAKTLRKKVWEEGVEPGGNNPFADNSYVEEVEMDILKKPMKAEEVKKSQARLLGGKTWDEYKQGVLERLDKWEAEKKKDATDTITARAEKRARAEKEKYIKGAKKAQEKNGMTDAEIERNGTSQYATFYAQEMAKLDDTLEAIEKQKQTFVDALETFTTDGVYALPTDIYDLGQLSFEPSFGKVIDIKISDNFSTAASTISFATLDGRRKITIPISGMVKQSNGEKKDIKPIIVSQTAQTRNGMFGSNVANTLKVLEQNVDNWDKLTSTATRKKGYIITGNLLKALTSLQKQHAGGKLISYTTDTGEIRQGVLMGDRFDPGALTSQNPISSAKEDLDDWDKGRKITSADGDVTIKADGYGSWMSYTLKVPKSKKKGEKYFNDKVLLSLMDGQFEGSSALKADFKEENLDAVLKRLDELGVTVQSKKEDTNNSESSLSRNAEINDSDGKAVPLERRTLKSYTDKDGNHHRGIEEEIAGLEADITRAGAGDGRVGEGGSEVHASPRSSDGLRINELRRQAARLRAEVARRKQKKQELRRKYNIDEKGNIGLDDLSRMFHDLNSSKILGKLFDKVVAVLKNLGVDFRFTDTLDANVGGRATAFINVTFYNWDAQLRDLDNQEKARILLHEMIHNVSSHILFRYKNPSLGKLTAAQEKLAKEIIDIYNFVKSKDPRRANGKDFYGLEDEHEMVAELTNPEFREMLSKIPYKEGQSVWQRLKDWFRKLFGLPAGNTALDSLSRTLDNILEGYDERENKTYRGQKAGWEREMRKAGYKGDYVEFWEDMQGGSGMPSIVEDPSEIARLDREPTERGYRTVVQNEDGTFGSPMANKLGRSGQKSKPTSPYKMGQWERSEENPHLANDKGKIDLIKPDGLGTVGSVDYNPYIHIRENKLNKQFKNAWERPNLVYIEVEYPKSEMTSGYRAEKAAKTVGRHKWPGGDLILSRWDKPVRVVPWEEVADTWEKEFKKRGVEFDIVSPHLLPILAERGVKILPPHKNMGEECNAAYERFKKEQENIDPLEAIIRSARQFRRQQVMDSDPMEAIRRAADAFRRESNVNNPNNPVTHSEKAVYDERLNSVETVFTEAYQDSMIALKTAQNAIAHDKDIPDSQNAYMAENLMHGKNKNEQDLFNKMFRDPLIDTINKIMDKVGMNWGDVDRYVYTKSGLERNREFFVRDWLERERNKNILNYEDLNPEEQDIFNRKAETIETLFEDGDIETEEQKEKELAKALQEAHKEYIDSIEERWIALKQKNYLDLQIGDINFADYLAGLTNFILDNIDGEYNPSEHDYSGFRAMYGDEDGNYDEDAIIDELMDTEDAIEAENVDTLWEQIQNCTRYGLERYREAGMRSDEQIDRVEQMFHWYVPMRGFKEDKGEDMYQYFTGKDKTKNYVGGLLKHAKGRGSEANYPISTIFAMTYKAISDCNQNLVNQKLYRLCQANPNDLVVLSDSWAVLNERTGEWEEVAPEIGDDMSEEEIREETLRFEEDMRQMASDGKAKKIKGKEHFDYKPMDKKKKSEHIVDVRINGQQKRMIVVGNPRMAQALNGQLRFEHGRNVFSKWNATIKNFMASVFTSYSPTFALRNMFRDWTHFRMMLGVREGHGYASRANKYYRQSLFKMVGLFKKYREGRLDENNEMERDFKDFMDNGGITGFVFMQKLDDIQKEMENIYKKQKAGKPIRLNNNLWEKILGAVEALNEGIENNARFATYRASRHYAGRTKARSAYDAKEITVNFNRKGAGSKTYGFKSQSKKVEDAAKVFGVTSQVLGEGRIFFNATVQAIATTFKNFQNADGSLNKKYIAKWAGKYALPPFMFGLALPLINKALAAAFGGDGDDDPYANLPEWTRRRNLCFYIGNGNFITIPIGQELAAFLTLGDIAAGNTYAPDLKPVDKSWDDEIVGVMNTFSPVDISTKITKGGLMEDPISEVTGRTFSVLAPLVAVEQNLAWTGRPIYREDRFGNDQYTPEYQMVYSGTNPVLVNAMKLLHEIGGGDDIVRGKLEVNPAIVQYLWEQYTGGPGKVFSNTISIGKDAKDILSGNESEFNIRKVEGLKAFVQQGDDRTEYYRVNAKYRKYKADAERLYDAVKGYEGGAAENPEYVLKLEQISKGEDFVRMQIVREADKQLSKINKAANKADGAERKELRRLYNQQVKAVVDMLDSVGE